MRISGALYSMSSAGLNTLVNVRIALGLQDFVGEAYPNNNGDDS